MRKLTFVGATALVATIACSQIVGITDTDVASGGSAPGASGKTANDAGQTNNGGSATAGGSDGTSQAGTMSSSGKAAGGTSAGGTSASGTNSGGTSSGGTVAGGTSSGGSQTGGAGGSATVLHGPKLIDIGTYSIDATEVTVGQYKEFLTAKAGDTSGQSAQCSWNKSYYEAAAVPLEANSFPIGNVDWCDAAAFCDWAGKRLCGAIAGGPVDSDDAFDATKSQWFRACGGPKGQTHPNDTPECNEKDGNGDVAAVASFPGCEGFYPGVFDLEGNAAEWIDSCDATTGKADHCMAIGGSELEQIAYCTGVDTDETRDFTSHYYGFRCCSK